MACAVALAASLAGCSFNPFGNLSGTPGSFATVPARVGQPVAMVVRFLDVPPGDRIEFLAAEPLDVADGAVVRLLLSRPVVRAGGDRIVGEVTETLEGAVVTGVSSSIGADNAVGIVAELTAQRPGRYELASIRLRYQSVQDGKRTREGVDVVMTVCADDPRPASCPRSP